MHRSGGNQWISAAPQALVPADSSDETEDGRADRPPGRTRSRRESESLKRKEIRMKHQIEKMISRLKLLADDAEGQDLVEYALLAGFVAVAAGALGYVVKRVVGCVALTHSTS